MMKGELYEIKFQLYNAIAIIFNDEFLMILTINVIRTVDILNNKTTSTQTALNVVTVKTEVQQQTPSHISG